MIEQTSNRTLIGKSAVIESGSTVLAGTVTRWSETSIWVTFEDGKQYRFTRSQDGQFRRVGRTTDAHAAPLVFMEADDVAALVAHRDGKAAPVSDAELEELLAPVGDVPPAPVSVTRIEFSKEQERTADRIQRVYALDKSWTASGAEARERVQQSYLDSFRIDALIIAAGRQPAARSMRFFLGKLEEAAVISEQGRLLEFTDAARAEELLGMLVEDAQESYEGWHKPNSTSNADVEIKLAEHEAWQSLYRVATGKRFY